jgi:hypothetical protein
LYRLGLASTTSLVSRRWSFILGPRRLIHRLESVLDTQFFQRVDLFLGPKRSGIFGGRRQVAVSGIGGGLASGSSLISRVKRQLPRSTFLLSRLDKGRAIRFERLGVGFGLVEGLPPQVLEVIDLGLREVAMLSSELFELVKRGRMQCREVKAEFSRYWEMRRRSGDPRSKIRRFGRRMGWAGIISREWSRAECVIVLLDLASGFRGRQRVQPLVDSEVAPRRFRAVQDALKLLPSCGIEGFGPRHDG